MNRLLDIGFECVGHWRLNDSDLAFELMRHGNQRNILYAFVCDGEVNYVGKTIQTLRARMQGYKSPAPNQSTNVRNNARLKAMLAEGLAVDILALPDNGLLHYGQFHYNLAAGLEDSIISIMKPQWNGRPEPMPPVIIEPPPPVIAVFELALQPTYYNRGFFNVPIANSDAFADDSEPIEIHCGNSEQPISGVINRRANQNKSPRIMGGAGLRDWFQSGLAPMQQICIHVMTPNSIQIVPVTG